MPDTDARETGEHRALIVVDVQNDFCEGGSLPVHGGAEVAHKISAHVLGRSKQYATIVATSDWHQDPVGHFAPDPDFVDSWPPHCRVGTIGALFHPAAAPALEHVEAIFRKGEHTAAYSGFEGVTSQYGEEVNLAHWLRERSIERVDIAGLATDHCVRATALDAVSKGFDTTVLLDLTAGVAPETTTAALDTMRGAGVRLVGDLRVF
jgi:nicotinamidase/pyrazinamidase